MSKVSKGRKTIDVELMKRRLNFILKTDEASEESRKTVVTIMEFMLFETNNYNGFSYLTKNDLGEGVTPGVNVDERGMVLEDYDARFEGCDEYRRFYN